MKLAFSILLALAVVAPTIVKADEAPRSQAMQEYIQRKTAEISAKTAELQVLQGDFERATFRKDASGVTAIIGLLGSSLSAGAALTLWGYNNEQSCASGSTCRLVVAGLIVADVAMIVGGGAVMTISVVQRDLILRNIKTKLNELNMEKASLISTLNPL